MLADSEADERHEQSSPLHIPGLRFESLFLFLIALLVGYLVRSSYVGVPAIHDDRFIEWLVGEVWLGRMPRLDAMLVSHSGQLSILGWGYYELILGSFGVDHPIWQINLLVAHATSSALLYVYLRNFLHGRMGPMLASLVWAGASIGYWDNQLLWNAMSMISWTTSLWLLCLVSAARVSHAHSLFWTMAGSAASLLLVLTWSVGTIFILSGPLLILLHGFQRQQPSRSFGVLALSWILALAIGGFSIGVAMNTARQGIATNVLTLERIESAFYVSPAIAAVALGHLTGWTGTALGSDDLVAKFCVAAVLMGLTLAYARSVWRWLLPLAIPVIAFMGAAGLLRADLGAEVILTSGRYLYSPTLLWCALAGCIADGLIRQSASRLPTFAWPMIVVVIVCLSWWHQHVVANKAREGFDRLWESTLADFDNKQETLARLEAISLRTGQDGLVFPEMPLTISPVVETYWLSTLAQVVRAPRASTIRIKPIDTLSDAEYRTAREFLGPIETRTAQDWLVTMRLLRQDAETIQWLQDLARNGDERILVPPVILTYATGRVLLSEFVKEGMSHSFDHLDFAGSESDRDRLRDRLSENTSAEAQTWLRWLQNKPAGDAAQSAPPSSEDTEATGPGSRKGVLSR